MFDPRNILRYRIRLAMSLGERLLTRSKTFQVQFFADFAKIHELTLAGKKGKLVPELRVRQTFAGQELEPEDRRAIMEAAEGAPNAGRLMDQLDQLGYQVDLKNIPAMEIEPATNEPITVTTKSFTIKATPRTFRITRPPNVISLGEDRAPLVQDHLSITEKGPRDAKRMYAWLLANILILEDLSHMELLTQMRKAGIDYK